jgi:hypothetical protein
MYPINLAERMGAAGFRVLACFAFSTIGPVERGV